MNIYSYIITHDTGFAPNPFYGYCTLACCKPVIRRTASVGDWIIGLSPKKFGNRIVFVMKVTEKLTFVEYWKNKKFRNKRAKMNAKALKPRVGDNIYKPITGGGFLQIPSRHSNSDGSENFDQKEHDLKGEFVLVSNDFSYFGGNTKKLPDRFSQIITGRGHKRFEFIEGSVRNRKSLERSLLRFIKKLPKGARRHPAIWPRDKKRDEKSRVCK